MDIPYKTGKKEYFFVYAIVFLENRLKNFILKEALKNNDIRHYFLSNSLGVILHLLCLIRARLQALKLIKNCRT